MIVIFQEKHPILARNVELLFSFSYLTQLLTILIKQWFLVKLQSKYI